MSEGMQSSHSCTRPEHTHPPENGVSIIEKCTKLLIHQLYIISCANIHDLTLNCS